MREAERLTEVYRAGVTGGEVDRRSRDPGPFSCPNGAEGDQGAGGGINAGTLIARRSATPALRLAVVFDGTGEQIAYMREEREQHVEAFGDGFRAAGQVDDERVAAEHGHSA